ncbi:hypothetical protein EGP95_05580 [bacterium]|nr:hypothetical protein [bacterium]
MYNYNPYLRNNLYYQDRFGFVVPFLLGGLGGAAVVGLSRPRPVYYTPQPYPNYNPYYYY